MDKVTRHSRAKRDGGRVNPSPVPLAPGSPRCSRPAPEARAKRDGGRVNPSPVPLAPGSPRCSRPAPEATGDASRLNRAASRRSSLRFGRNTPGPVLPVGTFIRPASSPGGGGNSRRPSPRRATGNGMARRNPPVQAAFAPSPDRSRRWAKGAAGVRGLGPRCRCEHRRVQPFSHQPCPVTVHALLHSDRALGAPARALVGPVLAGASDPVRGNRTIPSGALPGGTGRPVARSVSEPPLNPASRRRTAL